MLRYHLGYTLAYWISCTFGYRLGYKLGNRVEYKPAHTVVSHIYTYDRAQNILNFVQPLQNLIL